MTDTASKCGTYAGTSKHNREGTELCQACVIAKARYMDILRRRKELGMPQRGDQTEPSWKRVDGLAEMAAVGPVLDAGWRYCA